MDTATTILIVVLALAAVAAVVYALAKVSENRNPPIGQFIDVGGLRLHYRMQGQGDTIVLIHGNATMMQDYLTSGLVDRLAARHRVVLIDRPGFGYSARPRGETWSASRQARVLINALRQLGIHQATIVGHSWGALVAAAIAQQRPSLVRSLVLLSGYYFPQFRLDVLLVKPPSWPVIGDVLRYTLLPIVGAAFMPLQLRAMFGPPYTPRRFKDQFPISMMLRPWQIRATSEDGAVMNTSAAELVPGYGGLSMPVLAIAGRDDRIVNCSRQSEAFGRAIGGRAVTVAGAGHMVHHTHLESVSRAIAEHVAKLDA